MVVVHDSGTAKTQHCNYFVFRLVWQELHSAISWLRHLPTEVMLASASCLMIIIVY